jgi:hypothetical protein
MFVGHYGVRFTAKRVAPSVSLAVLFVAVQLLDVGWSILVLLGIEKLRIVPHFTASNHLDLYYMPFTHSLPGALAWSAAACVGYRLVTRRATWFPALVVGAAVFSHWVLDLLVHRPDLSLYDDSAKVGLGLWDYPAIELPLELAVLFGGLWLYLRTGVPRRTGMIVFTALLAAFQVYNLFAPPPASTQAFAVTALGSYVVLALVIGILEHRSRGALPAGAPHP